MLGLKKWATVLIMGINKDENISNYGYIGTSTLQIYRIYQRYIGKYFDTKYQ